MGSKLLTPAQKAVKLGVPLDGYLRMEEAFRRQQRHSQRIYRLKNRAVLDCELAEMRRCYEQGITVSQLALLTTRSEKQVMKLLGLTVDSLLTTEYIEMTLEEFMITGPGDLVSTRKGMRPYTNLTSLKTWKSKVWCTKKLLALDPDGSLGYTITTLDDWLRSKPENVNNPEESHDEDNDGTESIPDRIGDTGIPKGVQ